MEFHILLTKNIMFGFYEDYLCNCFGFTVINLSIESDKVEFAFLGLHFGINFNIQQYLDMEGR